MQLTAGRLLQGGKYIINRPLETQGFGITYHCTQTEQGQSVVLKTLHPALFKSRAFSRLRDRFVHLGVALTRTPHPNLVRVIELFQEGEWPFLVMEYIQGKSLAELVQPGQPIAEMEALHYIREISAGIQAGHRQGLVHGNLKPANIIRRVASNTCVVVGYGLSAERMLAAVQDAVPGFPHTFTAPEQIGPTGDRVKSADLYALAAHLYYLLTGEPPLAVNDRRPKTPHEQLPRLDQINPGLQQVIRQGLALNPAARPPSIEDWLQMLPRASSCRTAATAQQPQPRPTVAPMSPMLPQTTRLQVPTALESSPPPTQIQLPPPAESEPLQPASPLEPAAIAGLPDNVLTNDNVVTNNVATNAPTVLEPSITPAPPTALERASSLDTAPHSPDCVAPLPSPVQTAALPITPDRPRFRREPLESPAAPEEQRDRPEHRPMRPRFREQPVPHSANEARGLASDDINRVSSSRSIEPRPPLRSPRSNPHHPARSTQPRSWWTLQRLLVLSAILAAVGGILFGLLLRFSAPRTLVVKGGGGIFNSAQSFPDREWEGTLVPEELGDAPVESPIPSRSAGAMNEQPAAAPILAPAPVLQVPRTEKPAIPDPLELPVDRRPAPLPDVPTTAPSPALNPPDVRDVPADPAPPAAPIDVSPTVAPAPPDNSSVAPTPPQQ